MILHLGHQPADIGVPSSYLTTSTDYHDNRYDMNGLVALLGTDEKLCFELSFQPSVDLWFTFRYRRPAGSYELNVGAYDVVSFVNSGGEVVAGVELRHDDINQGLRTRAFVVGLNGRTYGSFDQRNPSDMTSWFDFKYEHDVVTNQTTVEFYIDEVLATAVTASPFHYTGVDVAGIQIQAPGSLSATALPIGVAHVAAIEGRSTLGRRFIRRLAAAQGSRNQWGGNVITLGDGEDFVSTPNYNRLETIESGDGPTLPIGGDIEAIHVVSTGEPSVTVSAVDFFVSLSGEDHFSGYVHMQGNRITKQVATFDLDPSTGLRWSAEPEEYGVASRR